MTRHLTVALLFLLMGTACAALPAGFVHFSGTYLDTEVVGGETLHPERKLELRLPSRMGVMPRRRGMPAAGQIRILEAKSGKVVREFTIESSYVSSDLECYLATSGSNACTLLLQHESFVHMRPAQQSQQKLTGRLLMSGHPGFVQVDGTYYWEVRVR